MRSQGKHQDISIGNGFKKIKRKGRKPDKCDFIRLRGFCTAEETIHRMRDILIICSSDKGLISLTCKEPGKLNKNVSNAVQSWALDRSRHFALCFAFREKHTFVLNPHVCVFGSPCPGRYLERKEDF